MDEALAILPARWASTRFPGKPLHEINGRPLLWHTWSQVRRAKLVSRVIVATDDTRIAEAAVGFGAEVALTDSNHPSGTDRIAEVARRETQAAIIVNVQADEPRMAPDTIDRLIGLLREDPKCGMATAAHGIREEADWENPNVVKVVLAADGTALYFSRSTIPFRREKGGRPMRRLQHQGIYAFRRRTLLDFVSWPPTPLEQAECLEQLRALEHGVRIRVLVTKSGTHGVDTLDDARKIERELL